MDKDREFLEKIAADECERLVPHNPIRAAFFLGEAKIALQYARKYLKDYDTIMRSPVSYDRGAEIANIQNSFEVVINMALGKVEW